MKKRTLGLFLGSLIVSLGAIVLATTPDKHADITFATYDNGDAATYYSGISDSLTGDSLRSALHSLNTNKRKSTVGYSSMGTSPSGQFKYTDYVTSSVKYDSNGQPYGDKIVSFYSGNATTAFNREHVWPNSHGGNAVEGDIHMPRPTIASENGSRGNSFYVEGKCSSTAGWDPAMESFGDETYRGDSARIIFYCMIAESKFNLLEADSHSTSNSNKDYMMGRLSDLIKWNINYPVLDREQRRNEGAEYLQGNRNPFIDHPEYACRIWGDSNATTKALCANATYPTVAHTAGIRMDDGYETSTTNTTAYTLKVGDTVNFLPFVDGAFNASVSWSLSDYSVTSSSYYSRGSYTNGVTIEGLAAGVSTLTLTYSYDDNGTAKTATASVLITVNTTGGGSGEGGGDATDVDDETSATYTVASTSSVTPTGTVPSGSSATYSQTYNTKGQITGGKNAVLTLSGYAGKVITGITLNMKSNGSSGAGSFNAVAGSTTLASTSGNFNTWYDNESYGTSYRDVHVSLTNDTHIIGTGENVTLTITGSTNSLYISSYKITYGVPGSGSVDPDEVTLTSISASGMTQNYQVGDTFSFDGVLTANYSDGNSVAVLPDEVSSPNMSTVGNKTITLSYTEGGVTKTTTYSIYVAQKQLALESISLSGQKTTYYVGDTFSFTGTCTAHYEESQSKVVTPTSVISPNMSTAGQKTITVSYTENGVTKTADYEITVNALVVESITLGAQTTEYYVGDELVKPTVTAHYNNGNSVNVTDQATFTGFNSSAATASQTITVSFGGQEETYTVSISERPVDPTPASGDFEKVTSLSEITAESEIIIVCTKSSTYYAFDARDAQNGYTAVTVTSDKIAYTQDTAKLTCNIKPVSGGYTIQVGSANTSNPGKYISGTSGSNKLNFDTSASTLTVAAATNNDRKGGGTWDVTSNTSVLSFNANSGNYRYRFYKSTTYTDANYYAVDFYMRTSSGGSTEKVLSSISLSNITTSYPQGSTFVKPTVTAHYDDESSAVVTTASFTGYNMQELGEQTVTAHYTENGVTKTADFTINVVMNTTVTTPIADFYNSINLPSSSGSAQYYDVKGVVVGVNGYQYYIQEGSYGLCVYGNDNYHPAWYAGVSVGDYVLLHAKVYKYSGLVETANYQVPDTTVSKLGTQALPDAVEYTSVSAFMNANQSTRISLSNLGVNSTNITTISNFSGSATGDQSFEAYDINSSSNLVTIFIHKSVVTSVKTAIVEKLQTITADDTVEFVRCVAAYFNGNQISLSSADQIIIHTPDEDKLAKWGENYLFIGNPAYDGQGTGTCKSANLYKDAKTALFVLEAEESGYIATLQSDSTYEAELARYLAWASACGDYSPFVEDYTFMSNARFNPVLGFESNITLIVVIISSITVLSFAGLLFFKKKVK